LPAGAVLIGHVVAILVRHLGPVGVIVGPAAGCWIRDCGDAACAVVGHAPRIAALVLDARHALDAVVTKLDEQRAGAGFGHFPQRFRRPREAEREHTIERVGHAGQKAVPIVAETQHAPARVGQRSQFARAVVAQADAVVVQIDNRGQLAGRAEVPLILIVARQPKRPVAVLHQRLKHTGRVRVAVVFVPREGMLPTVPLRDRHGTEHRVLGQTRPQRVRPTRPEWRGIRRRVRGVRRIVIQRQVY